MELSETDSRRLLTCMGIDHTLCKEKEELVMLLNKGLKRCQCFASVFGQDKKKLNPASLKTRDHLTNWLAKSFRSNYTLEEMAASWTIGNPEDDAFLDLRQTLQRIAEVHESEEGRIARIVLQDKNETKGMILDVMRVRSTDTDVPLLEVRYMYNTKASMNSAAVSAINRTSRGGPLLPIPCSALEIDLIKLLLDFNASKLTGAYMKACTKDWLLGDEFSASFVVPVHPLSPEESLRLKFMECPSCGKRDMKNHLKICSGCWEVAYCSAECQKTHWKEHKPVCKQLRSAGGSASDVQVDQKPQFTGKSQLPTPPPVQASHPEREPVASNEVKEKPSSSAGKAVLVSLVTAPPGGAFTIGIPRQASIQRSTVEDKIRDVTKVPVNSYGSANFLVKIQVPLMGHGALMLYDQKRSIQSFVNPEQSPYDPLRQAVQQHGYMGIKGYFWAKRVSDTDIEVYLGELPRQTQSW